MRHGGPSGQFELIGRLVWPSWPALAVGRHHPTNELRLLEEVSAAGIPEFASRLAADAMRAAQLSDRHLLKLHDWALTDRRDRAVLVWELPQAERLDSFRARCALDPATGIEISRQLLRALAALHRGGLVHGRFNHDLVLLAGDQNGVHATLAGLSLGRLPRLAARGSVRREAAAVNDVSAVARLAIELAGSALPASVRLDLERAAAPHEGEWSTVAELLFGIDAALPTRSAVVPPAPDVEQKTRWRPLAPGDHQRLAALLDALFPERARPPATDPLALEAWALVEAGDVEEAKRCVDLLLRRDPFHKLAHKLRQRLIAHAAVATPARSARVCADIDELIRQNRLHEALVELEAWASTHGEDDELASLRSYLEHRIAEARRQAAARPSARAGAPAPAPPPTSPAGPAGPTEHLAAKVPIEIATPNKRAAPADTALRIETPPPVPTAEPAGPAGEAPPNRLLQRVAENLRGLLEEGRLEEATRGLAAAVAQLGDDPGLAELRAAIAHQQAVEDELRAHHGRLLLRLLARGLDDTLAELDRLATELALPAAWRQHTESELRREALQGQAIEEIRARIKEFLGQGNLGGAERVLHDGKQRHGSAPFVTLEHELTELGDRARRQAATHLVNEGKTALAAGKTWTAIHTFERASALVPTDDEPRRLLGAAKNRAKLDPNHRKRDEQLAQARRRIGQLFERGRIERAQQLLTNTAEHLDANEELRDLRLRIERRNAPPSWRSVARWLTSRR